MGRFIIVFGLVFVSVAYAGALADEEEIGAKTVVGTRYPLYIQCFENARDGEIDARALEPCNRSLDEENLSPHKTAIAYANRGVVQFNVGDYEAAVTDFTASLRHGIHVQARVYANRGLSYEALHYDALARADYQAALALNPRNSTATQRIEELDKPLYDRSNLPRKITAEMPSPPAGGY